MSKEKYTVKYKDKEVVLNKNMVKSQNIDDHILEKIKEMHRIKLTIFWIMENRPVENMSDIAFLRRCDRLLNDVEFLLQGLWGFPLNASYHRFWERPLCLCPKMDNDDRYPTGQYIISEDCILHSNK